MGRVESSKVRPDDGPTGVDDPWFAVIVGVLGTAAAALPLFIVMAPDTAYYGTHVRIGEFLLGVAFALWWRRADRVASPRAARGWGWSGFVGLAALVVVMLSIDRTAGWVYRGGMGLMSIPVIAVMGGVLAGGPWVTAALSVRPLVWLGRAAFSIYVIHWPIFQVVEVELAGRGRGVIVSVELAVSLAVGYALHRWVEQPLLPGADTTAGRTWAKPKVAFSGAAIGLVVCLGAAAIVPKEEPKIDFARLAEDPSLSVEPMSVADAQRVLADGVSKGTEFPVFRDMSLVGVGLFGGSTALTLALGSDGWTQSPPWAQAVPGYAPLGCGVLDVGERAGGDDPGNLLPEGLVPPECSQRSLRWSATVRAYAIQVPVVVASSADLTTWRFSSDDEWSTIGSPAVDERLVDGLVDAIDAMIGAGATKVVLTTPMSPRRDQSTSVIAERRRRNHRYRELLEGIATTRPVEIVDLEAWSAAVSDDDFRELVPDGIHLSEAGAARAWSEVFGPVLDRMSVSL